MEIASCYEKLGKIEEAISYYQKVVRRHLIFMVGGRAAHSLSSI